MAPIKSWRAISRLLWRVKASGLFSARQYLEQNPDIGRFPPLLHWVKFGQSEGRAFGTSPLALWLLPLILTRDISPRQARTLSNMARKSPQKLAKLAAEHTLNINDFLYHQAMSDNDFARAYAYLDHTSDALTFKGAYTFATKHMRLGKLQHAYKWAQSQTSLSLDQAVKIVDIARALGKGHVEDAQRVLTILNKYPDKHPATHKLESQIFAARLPLIEMDTDICRTLKATGLRAITVNHPGRVGEFAREVHPFADLINLATYNMLFSSPLGIANIKDTGVQTAALNQSDTEALKVRLLLPHYWTESQKSNTVTGPVLELHKRLILEEFDKGRTLFPIMATPIFDITDENNWGLDTLSYHTIIRKKNAQNYFHYKEAYLPNFFCHDPLGYSGWSSLSEVCAADFTIDAQTANDFHTDLYARYVKGQATKYPSTQTEARAGAQTGAQTGAHTQHLQNTPYIFVALQVPNDTVAYWSHMPTSVWAKHVCECAARYNFPVIIKAHPMDKSIATKSLVNLLTQMPHVHLSTQPIHTLLDGCLALVTTNSGVGFEALLHHKPVLNCGRSDYMAVTTEVKTTADIDNAFNALSTHTHPYTVDQFNTFLYAYCTKHCLMGEAPPAQ